jgi:glycine/serine hydroxymethyltransferase
VASAVRIGCAEINRGRGRANQRNYVSKLSELVEFFSDESLVEPTPARVEEWFRRFAVYGRFHVRDREKIT